MKTTTRLTALALSIIVTTLLLSGIHGLADPGADNARMARAAASQPAV